MANPIFYLDEDIIISVPVEAGTDRYVSYTVILNENDIYRGRYFVTRNTTNMDIYINDIILSQKINYTDFFKNQNIEVRGVTLQYDMQILTEEDKTVDFTVYAISRYPNKDIEFNKDFTYNIFGTVPQLPNNCFYTGMFRSNFNIEGYGHIITDSGLFVYGFNMPSKSTRLITKNFSELSEFGNELYFYIYNEETQYIKIDIHVKLYNDAEWERFRNEMLSFPYNQLTEVELRKIFDNKEGIIYSEVFHVDDTTDIEAFYYERYDLLENKLEGLGTIEGQLDEYVPPQYKVKIATINQCPYRYYLKWVDRFGGVNYQPMKGKCTYSESIDTSTITNKYEHKKVIGKNITSKWNLNSGYITDIEYITFEGLFGSPIVQLIDTEQDKTFTVLVNNSNYTEQSFKNNKKFLNFNIEVVLDKSFNQLY